MQMSFNEAESVLERTIDPAVRKLTGDVDVRRALPSKQRRMVGPFVFLDQMGRHEFPAGSGLDVPPHPHIGLATVTYLLEGEIVHRDSLGNEQTIRPGEVNWMTAGRGIVHSERTDHEQRKQAHKLFGVQCWVALPKAREEVDPSFVHYKENDLPVEKRDGVESRVIAGRFFGKESPAPTLSPMCLVDVRMHALSQLTVPSEYEEQALYVLEGTIDLGLDGVFEAGQLLVIKPGHSVPIATDNSGARLLLLGGEPLDGPRAIAWNFVSSSQERLDQAGDDWNHRRFPEIPGETGRIPMPETSGKPVFYP